ncbi:MAG: hypothetical protein JNK15_24865 [Planctomycetes bacterium]|nr:hypothetical protein [Planctomycetota bacterium]
MTGAPAPVRRSRARRCLFAVLLLAAVWLACELAAVGAWTLHTGSAFTWGRAAAARQAAREGVGLAGGAGGEVDPAHDAVTAAVVPHPFLGFVVDADKPIGVPVSRWGFVDVGEPIRRRTADRFVVALVGGSVALQLAHHAEPELVAALRRSPALAGRTVEIVRLALGGYKQPQQLLAIEWLSSLGAEFDCVVNLDGYNEIALVDENVGHGVPEWYPRSWGRLQDRQPSTDQLLRLGELAVLRRDRIERATAAEALWWSPLRQILWAWRDGKDVARIAALRAAIERAAVAPSFAVTGPGSGGRSLDAARAEMVALWARASRQLHEVCRTRGMLYCHFLQPNQYVPGAKPIGPAEARVALLPDDARGQAVAAWYPRLQAEGRALAAVGVPFVDLTWIFLDHAEPLYVDTCCHLGPDGNRLLAEHVAAGIRTQLDLAGIVLRSLAVEPARVAVQSPFAHERIRVVATDDRGGRHDLGGAGFGVRYSVVPAGLCTIAADGTLVPSRCGSGSLRVDYRGLATEVPVTIAWPGLVVGADGIPADGVVPRIDVQLAVAAGGTEAALEVRCSDLPGAPFRVVVVGRRRLPDSPIAADPGDLLAVPVVETGPEASVRVAVAPGDEGPWFVRAYCLDRAASAVVAASPTVVRRRT